MSFFLGTAFEGALLRSIRPAVDVLSSHVALLDPDGVIVAVNKAWLDFSASNGGRGDYVGVNYLEVCKRSASDGSKGAARTFAGLTRVLAGSSRSYGLAYECSGSIFRLRAMAIASDDGRQVLVSHEDITAMVRARSVVRQARLAEERLAEEVGQRLAAIGLAVHVLRREGANPKAVTTIELALDEARHELKLMRKRGGAAGASPPR
jgi:hypothetical protein